MAAYAALVSVMRILDDLEHHPRPPISLHRNQVYILTQKITFLQHFLEGYNTHLGYSAEADPLETRIADAAHAAEDFIETRIVDHVINDEKKISSNDALHEALEKVIEDMALLEKEAMQIKHTEEDVQHQLQSWSTPPPDSSRSSPASVLQESSMVGADDVLLQVKDKLRSDHLALQIIPIVGMGGSGKTTLARNIYQDRLIMEHFHVTAWSTISQEYSIREILKHLLEQLDQKVSEHSSQGELGDMLHRHLYGRRYLIVLDDMWSIRAWEGIRMFLPNNKNGSRVIVTTRLSNLASQLPNSSSLDMKLLDEADSWDLLSKTVFGEKGCPLELEEIGKKIGKNCNGLPLSIVVVGGFLAKSKHTRRFWRYIEENLNSIVNVEDNEHCLKILYMSYKQLPVYLKPCFLYMGVFPEDEVIRVSKLVKLWVAEGFLKPVSGKSLEEIAKEYLGELISRNLIMIHESGSTGNVKQCKLHDLLRDLSLREAEKERFYTHNPQGIISGQRRIVISSTTSVDVAIGTSHSMSLARSLMWYIDRTMPPLLNCRLLRILDPLDSSDCLHFRDGEKLLENVSALVNSRFLSFRIGHENKIPDSLWQFWNIHTLLIDNIMVLPFRGSRDIWHMHRIRHLQFTYGIILPNLHDDSQDDNTVLGNLQSLRKLVKFKCCELMVKKIPNIKKLELDYYNLDADEYCLSNLNCFDKLETLIFIAFQVIDGDLITFPHSLKKLTIDFKDPQYCWDDLLDKIGALPLLQKLKLIEGCFGEGKWETSEGQFRSLKFLSLRRCRRLQVWTTESSHFPCLEHLLLAEVTKLKEIPLEFADISTLEAIDVRFCSDSVVESAKRIVEEQEDSYGEEATLRVQVRLSKFRNNRAALESLASPNFRII